MKTNTMTLHIGHHMINYAFKMLFTDRDKEVWKLSPIDLGTKRNLRERKFSKDIFLKLRENNGTLFPLAVVQCLDYVCQY